MDGCQRIAIDPKGMLELDVVPARHPLSIDWDQPIIHYIPSVLDRGEYEQLYDEIWAHRGPPMLVWLDEAMGPTMAGYGPPGMNLVVQQGAGLRMGHFACSQRPQNIAMGLRTEAEHIFVFVPAIHHRDLEELAREMAISSQELADRLRALKDTEGDHSFIWYCRASNEIIELAPLDLPGAPVEEEPVDEPEPELEEEEQNPGPRGDPPGAPLPHHENG
jgi:hypothetical protein